MDEDLKRETARLDWGAYLIAATVVVCTLAIVFTLLGAA